MAEAAAAWLSSRRDHILYPIASLPPSLPPSLANRPRPGSEQHQRPEAAFAWLSLPRASFLGRASFSGFDSTRVGEIVGVRRRGREGRKEVGREGGCAYLEPLRFVDLKSSIMTSSFPPSSSSSFFSFQHTLDTASFSPEALNFPRQTAACTGQPEEGMSSFPFAGDVHDPILF